MLVGCQDEQLICDSNMETHACTADQAGAGVLQVTSGIASMSLAE